MKFSARGPGLIAAVLMFACIEARNAPEEVEGGAGVPMRGPASLDAGAAGDGNAPGPVAGDGPTMSPGPMCGAADGLCPHGCAAEADVDCRLQPGKPCQRDDQCVGQICIDGTCCLRACPACQTCAGAGGTCTNIAPGQPDDSGPDRCPASSECDGRGACRIRTGLPCSAGSDCRSGFCVDGVCCNVSCDDLCRSCAVQPGTCSDVVNDHDGPGCLAPDQVCVAASSCAQVDQHQNEPDTGNGTLELANVLGQTFTAGRAGRLVGVRVKVHCSGGLVTEVRTVSNGVPGSTVLTSQFTDGLSLTASERRDVALVAFERPVQVQAGNKLALVFRPQTTKCFYTGYFGAFDDPGKQHDAYRGGAQVFIDARIGPDWQILAENDIGFETLMEP